MRDLVLFCDAIASVCIGAAVNKLAVVAVAAEAEFLSGSVQHRDRLYVESALLLTAPFSRVSQVAPALGKLKARIWYVLVNVFWPMMSQVSPSLTVYVLVHDVELEEYSCAEASRAVVASPSRAEAHALTPRTIMTAKYHPSVLFDVNGTAVLVCVLQVTRRC